MVISSINMTIIMHLAVITLYRMELSEKATHLVTVRNQWEGERLQRSDHISHLCHSQPL